MKTKFLLFSLMLSLLSITNLWADDATMTAGTNGSSAEVNNKSAIKVGTSKAGGDMSITVPAGATTLHLYAAAWKGVSGLSLNLSGATVSPTSISLTADNGISNNSPFTLSGDENDFKFDISLSNITAETTIKFTSSAAKRFVVWGATYESGVSPTPTQCATPTFTPAGGITFYGSQDVAIASTTQGAVIHYTLDGSDPTSSSSTYSAPINLTGTTTIRAIAIKDGMENSDVASATYTAGEAVTSYDIDFETNNLEAYVNWEFTNIGIKTTTITAHGGNYYGANINGGGSGVATASIKTKQKFANPGILTFFISKESTNTTACYWKAQVSSDGSTWTDVETFDAKSMTKGNWNKCEADLSGYTNVYVQISYGSSTAIRAIDDISLEEASSVAKPSITGTDKFLTSSEITITQDEADAIYYTTNGSTPTTSSTKYTAPFSITETTMVKAIAVKGTDVSAVAEATFTKATVMTIAQARAAIDAGGDLTNKYVKGIISQIDSYNSSYHSITYWISDEGTTTNQLEVYSGLAGVVKTQFESENDIHVGEEVIVKGTLKKYNSIYEFDKNNTIEAYKSLSPIAWSTNAYTAELNSSTNEFPTLSGTAGLTITYSSSDPTKAEIAQDGAITLHATGETTITASSAATETYVKTDVSYTLTIEESVVRVSITFVENGGEPEQTDLTEQTNLPNPLPAIAKAGYNFGGWYTDENFQTLAVAGAEITENTTLYAQWLEPYTVAVALVKIAALPDGGETENVYVQGVVTGDVSISGTSAIYDIKDASVDNRLAIYKGKGLNGADVTAGDIQDGDQVVVYGKLYKYVKNQQVTPEVAQGNYLYSLDRPTVTVTGVTLPATASVKVGKTITLTPMIVPSNASNKNVTWSITSGSDYASVSEGVITGLAAGEAVIQVTTEDGGYTASCTVTVAEAPDFAHGDWILVADANELTAGSYVIIAAAEYDYAMQPWVSGANHCVRKAATKDGDLLTYDSDFAIFEVKDYVVEEVVQGKSFLNVESDGYLCYSSGLKEQATQTNASAWTLNFDANDVFHAFNKNANTYEIQYNKNSGSERFACYTSSQQAIALYKYYAPVPKVLYDKNTEEDVTNLPSATRAELEDNVYKATISTTTPHRSGYQFTGWKDADNNDYIAGNKYTITDDITLFAQWNMLAGHHITYVTVGTAPTDENTYYAGDAVTLASADGLSNPGYVFDGWNDGSQTYPANYEEYQMPDNDVTFTAVWSRVSTQKWVLVENLSDIKTDGTEYVIVAAGYNVAMAALNSDIYTTTPVVKNGNVLTGSESMIPLTFVAGSGDGVLAMKHGDLYLASTTEKKMTERETAFYWSVSIADGVATFETLIGANTCQLQYNSGSPRFTTYKSTQKPLALYEKAPMVEIKNNETVQASTVPGADIVIYDGGTLAVNDQASIGDLTVEEGGKVTLSNKKLTVTGTFAIETKMGSGKSGELNGVNGSNFAVTGDAYIDITLGDNGNADKWHAFTVPFPVDALNGIFDLNGNKLTNEQNYAIMDYHGDIRAEGKYGWKKFRGTLVPGTFYLMTVDGLRTTYRMKMKAGSTVVAANSKYVYEYAASGEGQATTDAGWNGIGNPTLAYGQVGVAVQVLDPVNYVYVTKDANTCNFIVGTPFFYQAAGDGEIPVLGEDNEKPYYAPIRKAVKTTEQIKVSLANENYTDNLFISASEDATNNYQIGKDLVKMTMTNTPIVPQIFGVAYKTQLSMVHAPLVGDRANYTLNLYAPADGEYTISAQQTEDAIVYLTYEGSPIWNITSGEYNCDLQKGNNSGFGLMLVRRAPQVTTDIEGANQSQNGVRKLLINGQLFIEKEGKLFNVTGQRL